MASLPSRCSHKYTRDSSPQTMSWLGSSIIFISLLPMYRTSFFMSWVTTSQSSFDMQRPLVCYPLHPRSCNTHTVPFFQSVRIEEMNKPKSKDKDMSHPRDPAVRAISPRVTSLPPNDAERPPHRYRNHSHRWHSPRPPHSKPPNPPSPGINPTVSL